MSKKIGPHRDGILEERVDDELLVYNPVTDTYFNLNRTATTVWDLATGQQTVDEIATTVAKQFGIAPEDVIDDVAAIATQFAEAGLLDDPANDD